MILAVSRFKVVNGLEATVSDAFLNRPHLVDTVPGFLGMETFVDTAERCAFYLVTRWTDTESYHRWHKSEAHQRAHQGIPKGLKLDPSFTRILVLERLADPEAESSMAEFSADHAPFLTCCLRDTGALHVVIADREGRLRACNNAFAACLGQVPAELLGCEVLSFLNEHDAELLEARIRSGERRPEDVFLLNFVDKAGLPVTLRCRLDVHPDRLVLLGEPTFREMRAYEDELVQLNNELAVLNRENAHRGRALERALGELRSTQAMRVHREKMVALGQMTAGITHEINNPLAFVLNNHKTLRRDFEDLLAFANRVSEILESPEGPSPAALEQLREQVRELELEHLAQTVPHKIEADAEGLCRIRDLVRDLRTFSRRDEAEFKECDLRETVASTLRWLSPLAAEHQVEIDNAVPASAPLYCSPSALNQALSGVIANAVQASRPGQTVRITARQVDTEVLIVVEDSGSGIAEEHLPRVCEPFFTTKPPGRGTGLGLSIAHQIVAGHQGSLDLESTPGVGTRVTIRLPRSLDSASARAPS